MKTTFTHHPINVFAKTTVSLALISIILQGCTRTVYVQEAPPARPAPPAQYTQREVVVPPAWAPQYENVQQVRYYYLPDIGVYYDVWGNQYIYPQAGGWMYASALPPTYSYYNVNNGFVVVLNTNVYQPWTNHVYYQNQYPRNYSQTIVNNNTVVNNNTTIVNNGTTNATVIRGYNENVKTPIYNTPAQTKTTNTPTNNNLRQPNAPAPAPVPTHNNNEPNRTPGVNTHPINEPVPAPSPSQNNGNIRPVNNQVSQPSAPTPSRQVTPEQNGNPVNRQNSQAPNNQNINAQPNVPPVRPNNENIKNVNPAEPRNPEIQRQGNQRTNEPPVNNNPNNRPGLMPAPRPRPNPNKAPKNNTQQRAVAPKMEKEK